MMSRMSAVVLPDRRSHCTQKVKIGGTRTLYLSVNALAAPAELFLRVRGAEASAEVVCLYDTIARLVSALLQAGMPVAEVAARLHGTRCAPAGPVTGDDRIKFCDGVLDYVGRYLLVHAAGWDHVAHVPAERPADDEGGLR